MMSASSIVTDGQVASYRRTGARHPERTGICRSPASNQSRSGPAARMVGVIDKLSMLSVPWVFSQSQPLSTSALLSEMKKRGISLDSRTLREFYRRRDLEPLAEITTRPVRPAMAVPDVPAARGSQQAELRLALASGRVRDPGADGFQPRLRFDDRRPGDPQRWMNGLIYSRWQLLAAPELRRRLPLRRLSGPYERRRVILPPLDEWSRAPLERIAAWVPVLAAVEARYLPTIDPEWLRLTNVEVEEWDQFCTVYDPVAMSITLEVKPDEVKAFAEWLLHRAHNLDPTGDWSQLIRRAPERAWKTLTGDALVALDHRLAAEVLLLFYEDLAQRHAAPPLPQLQSLVWHPLSERISDQRDEELDSLLVHLGVSPHPGVVLVVEGETEELLVNRVFDHLELRRTPDLVRVLCMRGADRELPLLAAATVAPLLGQRHGETYDMIRPPTRLVIAVDQDQGWDTPAKINRKRANILTAIRKVIAAQGAKVSDEDLETFVIVKQWSARCFEFAHFDDTDLADALRRINPSCGGLSQTELIARIAMIRARDLDIKKVWDQNWAPQPSKVALAEALWPTLKAKIDDARWSEIKPIPAVAEVVHEAYLLAQRSRIGTFVIRSADPEPTKDAPSN
jgi:hypothetical protein